MVRYLLIDDRDGRVLAELSSAEQAARLLARAARTSDGGLTFSVVRIEHAEGSVAGVDSRISMRTLPPLTTRPFRSRGR